MSQIRGFFCSPWESTTNPCSPARTHTGSIQLPRAERWRRSRAAGPPRPPPALPPRAGPHLHVGAPPTAGTGRAFPLPRGRGFGDRETRLIRLVFLSNSSHLLSSPPSAPPHPHSPFSWCTEYFQCKGSVLTPYGD